MRRRSLHKAVTEELSVKKNSLGIVRRHAEGYAQFNWAVGWNSEKENDALRQRKRRARKKMKTIRIGLLFYLMLFKWNTSWL